MKDLLTIDFSKNFNFDTYKRKSSMNFKAPKKVGEDLAKNHMDYVESELKKWKEKNKEATK
ncbi:hypothetical protein [Gracilimonas sp.]|uniref:hypothetical protein n=1 Tax=Gracilimonas sp. TaxID=1974203 RepID=UPI0032EC4134